MVFINYLINTHLCNNLYNILHNNFFLFIDCFFLNFGNANNFFVQTETF